MELLSGLIGALIGGLFVLAGSWYQGRQQTKALLTQLEHERRMSAEAHNREQVAAENERLRERIDIQLSYGRSVMKAACAFETMGKKAKTQEEQIAKCLEALELAGQSRSQPSPYPSFLQGEEIEDQELRGMLTEHRDHTMSVEYAFGVMDHTKLPENCWELYETVDDLARRIGVRWRQLQREGKPI